MKKVVLNEYIKGNKAEFTKIRLRMGKTRSPLKRERDKDEKAILLKLDKARWERWIEDGKIQILGDRKFRFRLG